MSVFRRAPRARIASLSLVLLLATLAGCDLKSGGYNTVSPPKIRFFNASMEIGAVDVTVGTVPIAGGFNYELFTNYATTQTGPQTITLAQSGTTTPLVQTTQDFESGSRFSYVLFGRVSAPVALLLSDNIELPGGGHYKLRLVNAATDQGPIDVYVTDPGASLDNAAPAASGIALGSASDILELDAGSREVRITAQGSKTPLFDSGQITLNERNAYSIVAYSRGDPRLVNVGLLTLDTLGSGSLLASLLSDVRLVNATPATPLADMLVDGNVHIGSVPFGVVSNYQSEAGGEHTVSFTPTGVPGTTLITGSLTFPPGGNNTVALFGNAGAQSAFVLQDVNFQPVTPTNARVRVVDLLSNNQTFQTFVNGALTVGTLGPAQPSLYFELPAATYTFAFVDPTNSTTVFQDANVALAAGHTYTVFVMGTTGQVRDLVSLDR